MAFKLTLLVLPILALASIDVEISIRDKNNLKVHYKGNDIGIISETERTTFDVNNERLKESANLYFGLRPANVYVHNPTSSGEIHVVRGQKWDEVTRTLVPRSGNIIWDSGTSTVVAYETFENNSTIPVTFNIAISESVVNTVSSSWHESGELSGIKINYCIKNKVANVDGEPFNYTSSWGHHTLQSQTVTIGASSKKYMTLRPGEAVAARLEATRELVKVEIKYDASLSGQVVADYVMPWMGFFQNIMPIDVCMQNAINRNQRTSREFIDIEFFSDSKVVVSDLRQGNILMELR